MNHPNNPTPDVGRFPRRLKLFALAILIAGVIAGGLIALTWGGRSHDIEFTDWPGLKTPRTVAAARSNLPDKALVIGVTINGRHRAYAVPVMENVNCHVVNDLIGEVPVTVVYCDRTDCVTAYQGDSSSAPLGIGVAGYLHAGTSSTMLMKLDDTLYRQDNGQPLREGDPPFPHRAIEITQTTWRAWRAAHPDTDIFDGDSRWSDGEPR